MYLHVQSLDDAHIPASLVASARIPLGEYYDSLTLFRLLLRVHGDVAAWAIQPLASEGVATGRNACNHLVLASEASLLPKRMAACLAQSAGRQEVGHGAECGASEIDLEYSDEKQER